MNYESARAEPCRQGGQLKATLKNKQKIADDTYELTFDLGAETIDFLAGQYCRIWLPELNGTDEKPSRKFSIVNSPDDNHRLVIATRSGISAYKTKLLALQPGEQVIIEKIKGKLVLPQHSARPNVFVAGGIGIVPFISMLRDLEHKRAVRDITLLYFNRTLSSSPYLAELQQLAASNSGLRLVPVMTRDASWQGEIARFSAQLLTTLLADIKGYNYYVVGTTSMVEASIDALRTSGVNADQICTEDFTGYAWRPA